MEAFLDQTGDLDLNESDGPTGYAGARLVNALATYQKRNDLTPDGLANPDGPTVKQMARDERERPLPNPDYPWPGSYPGWDKGCEKETARADNEENYAREMRTELRLAEANLQSERKALNKLLADYEKALLEARIRGAGKHPAATNRALHIVQSQFVPLLQGQRDRVKEAEQEVAKKKDVSLKADKKALALLRERKACLDEQKKRLAR